MYKPPKKRNYQQGMFSGYKSSGRGNISARGSKPDISGSIPKVAFELSKRLKDDHDGGELSVQILGSDKTFVYSVRLLGNSSIKIDYELCKVKSRNGTDFSIPPENCMDCKYGNCGIDSSMSDLIEYLKSYGNISAENPLGGANSVSMHKIAVGIKCENDEEFLGRKIGEYRRRGWTY